MNTPPAEAGGFPGKLCGNPLAWRLEAGPRPKVGPLQYDPSCRHVSVKGTPTFATMFSDGEWLSFDRTAFGADLTCPARIDQHDHGTGACSLVLNELDELRPRGVVDGFSEHSARQPRDVQVLHSDVRESVHQRPGQFVCEVAAAVADSGRQTGDTKRGFALALTAASFAGDGSLGAAQGIGCLLGERRRRNGFADGQRNHRRQAQVDADRSKCPFSHFGVWGVELKVYEPLPSSVALDHGSANRCARRHFAVPLHLDLAGNADDAEAPALADGQPVANAEVGAIEAAFGAETGEARLTSSLQATKECREVLFQPAQNLLLRRKTVSGEPFIHSSYSLQLGGLVAVAQTNPAPAVSFDSLLKRGVIQIAKGPEHRGQTIALSAVRIDAKFVGEYQLGGLPIRHSGSLVKNPSERSNASAGSPFVPSQIPGSKIALYGLILALGACSPPPPVVAPVVVAPMPIEYTCADQRQLANEYASLPVGSMLKTAIVDYGRERDQLRAVHGLPKPAACP